MNIRVGQGFDVHAFTDGDHVMLCGVRLPHDQGLAAHSDGDVAIHALCDALLGSLALGDIGHHFPPDDEQWKNASGARLLQGVLGLLSERGWQPVNIDLTVICEHPKLSPRMDEMRTTLAGLLNMAKDTVSIKATTTEKLGFCGRGEGIAAQAVVLIQREQAV